MSADRRSSRDRMTPAVRRLELLCARRTAQRGDPSIAPIMAHRLRELQKQASQQDPTLQVFSRHVPAELSGRCALRLDRGILRVAVADSSTRFALDRLLRAGVKDRIIRESSVPIRDIRLEQAAPNRRRASARGSRPPSTNDPSS